QVLSPAENLWAKSNDFTSDLWPYTGGLTPTAGAVTSPTGSSMTQLACTSTSSSYMLTAANIALPNNPTKVSFVVEVNTGATASDSTNATGRTIVWGINNTSVETAIFLEGPAQLVEFEFVPPAATGNQFYITLSGAPHQNGLGLESGHAIYISDFTLNAGVAYKTPAVTTGSATSNQSVSMAAGLGAATSLVPYDTVTNVSYPQINVQEVSAGFYVVSSSPLNAALNQFGQYTGTVIIRTNAPAGETFILIPADGDTKKGGDAVCTGSGDDQIINAAISALHGTTRRGKGGKILLREGTFGLTSFINTATSYITLEGEGAPNWDGYMTDYTQGGVSLEGISGAKLKMLTSGVNIIEGGGPFRYGTDGRNKGQHFKNLLLFGTGNQIGIQDGTNTDTSVIEGCFFHNMGQYAIAVQWDSSVIKENSIQSSSGGGIFLTSDNYGRVINNIIYDCGGIQVNSGTTTGANAIQVGGNGGVTISGNIIGSFGTVAYPVSAILLTTPANGVIDNIIEFLVGGSFIELSGAACTNNTVGFNRCSMSGIVAKYSSIANNLAGNGIYLHNNAAKNIVSLNTLDNTLTGTVTGNAILADSTTANNILEPNMITGGKWAGTGGVSIAGTGNVVSGGANVVAT
ncbi:MAG: right-handed parallel beta-helix repeat-containing protein, partial [Methylomonas sp.]